MSKPGFTVNPEHLRIATQAWREGISVPSNNAVLDQALVELWTFLLSDALVVEKVDGEWPAWAQRCISDNFLARDALDALANRVAESRQ